MKNFLFVCLATVVLAACGANLSTDRYATSGAGHVNTVSEGVIINVRPVTIATENGEVGQLAGGIVGGVAGGMVSDNTLAQTIGAVGGAVLGGYLGGKAQEGLSMQGGMEYIVKLDSGKSVTLTQGDDEVFSVGQRVYVTDLPESSKSVTLTQGDDEVFSVGQRVYVLDADYDERARIIAQ